MKAAPSFLMAPPPALTRQQETGDTQAYKSAPVCAGGGILIPFSPAFIGEKQIPLQLLLGTVSGLFRLSIVMDSPAYSYAYGRLDQYWSLFHNSQKK